MNESEKTSGCELSVFLMFYYTIVIVIVIIIRKYLMGKNIFFKSSHTA